MILPLMRRAFEDFPTSFKRQSYLSRNQLQQGRMNLMELAVGADTILTQRTAGFLQLAVQLIGAFFNKAI